MSKTYIKRCPQCGFLDVVKWGKRNSHIRYHCKNYVKWDLFLNNNKNKAAKELIYSLRYHQPFLTSLPIISLHFICLLCFVIEQMRICVLHQHLFSYYMNNHNSNNNLSQ